MSSKRPGSFEAEFRRRYEEIKERGAAIGLTVSAICAGAEVARATPERWKKRTPLTIRLIDRMEQMVLQAEQERAQREPQA